MGESVGGSIVESVSMLARGWSGSGLTGSFTGRPIGVSTIRWSIGGIIGGSMGVSVGGLAVGGGDWSRGSVVELVTGYPARPFLAVSNVCGPI